MIRQFKPEITVAEQPFPFMARVTASAPGFAYRKCEHQARLCKLTPVLRLACPEIVAPYGQTFALKSPLANVECWNRNDHERFTLPAGTLLKLEHANDAKHTTCMASREMFPGCYRWIVGNVELEAAIGIEIPHVTGDLIGELIAYESGEATPKQTRQLFTTLRKTGIGSKLQGHYSSRM